MGQKTVVNRILDSLTIKKITRECDFICRYGGDEFCVILPETGKDGSLIYASRLKDEVEKLEIKEIGEDNNAGYFRVTVSIGIVQYPNAAAEKDELIKCADYALFEAKKRKNRIVYYKK